MPSHLQFIGQTKERNYVAESAHDSALQVWAALSRHQVEGLVWRLVDNKDKWVLSPADGSSITLSKNGGLQVVRPIDATEDMARTNAADVLSILLDRAWLREMPAPNSFRQRKYASIVKTLIEAAQKYGLEIPVGHPVIENALARAGLDREKLRLPAAPEDLDLDPSQALQFETRRRPEVTGLDMRYGSPPPRRTRADALAERGPLSELVADMMPEEPTPSAYASRIDALDKQLDTLSMGRKAPILSM